MKPKAEIRSYVWELLQKRKAARFPGAKGRIPNFIGAEACAQTIRRDSLLESRQGFKEQPRLAAARHPAKSAGGRENRLHGRAAAA